MAKGKGKGRKGAAKGAKGRAAAKKPAAGSSSSAAAAERRSGPVPGTPKARRRRAAAATSPGETLLAESGLCQVETTGNGNCLFNALSVQLFGSERFHMELRQNTVRELRDNEALYLGFMCEEMARRTGGRRRAARQAAARISKGSKADADAADDDGLQKLYRARLGDMERGGTWGDETEVSGFAARYQVKVSVYHSAGTVSVYQEHLAGRHAVVFFDENASHYSTVRNANGPHSGPPDCFNLGATKEAKHLAAADGTVVSCGAVVSSPRSSSVSSKRSFSEREEEEEDEKGADDGDDSEYRPTKKSRSSSPDSGSSTSSSSPSSSPSQRSSPAPTSGSRSDSTTPASSASETTRAPSGAETRLKPNGPKRLGGQVAAKAAPTRSKAGVKTRGQKESAVGGKKPGAREPTEAQEEAPVAAEDIGEPGAEVQGAVEDMDSPAKEEEAAWVGEEDMQGPQARGRKEAKKEGREEEKLGSPEKPIGKAVPQYDGVMDVDEAGRLGTPSDDSSSSWSVMAELEL